MNWIDVAANESAGKDVKLASLTPKFDEDSHRVYSDLLARAIAASGVRNVALTGAYGTGKSSVLSQLREQRGDEVIEISLSTIAPQNYKEDGDNPPQDEKTQTNLIQKEIVKQLLYRLPAHQTPRSRFRRTSAPRMGRDWVVSAIFGVSLTTVALLLGLLQPLVESAIPEPWGRRVLAYFLVAIGATCAAWLTRRLVAGGTTMSASVGAGLTSVSLSSATSTYFDEYLDEIVYFFQASKTKVVVIEDIDRFKDVKVFDTLRALNVLLNSSSTLGRIVFVYAIRDSIFEQIDDGTNLIEQDATQRAIYVANRAKFFDVIVPVVPFVNADNARDLMSRAMKSKDFSIDQSLIRISARHVADMRLIHNIRNEFEVYRNRLIVPTSRVYGITEDLVFAMVVFKNAHLGDFEKIRTKDSTLDHLYTSWRRLVKANLKSEIAGLDTVRTAVEDDESADARASLWGKRLAEFVDTLRASMQADGGQTSLDFTGEIEETKLTQRSTWRAIASGTPVRLYARNARGYASTLTFSAERIGALLGVTVEESAWNEPVRSELLEQIEKSEERIRFLRHHTWEELCQRPEFVLQTPEGRLTFDQIVEKEIDSLLVRELVRRGFITSHFALYTSTYYGTHLGPDALEYVRRCVEPGEPDALFPLEFKSVQQLLTEQGADDDDNADIFDDSSVLNVSIVNYLLRERPAAAAKIAERLAAWGNSESEFVATYCARGDEPERLLAAMTPWWPDALQYAAVDATLPPDRRMGAVNAVLAALPRSEGYYADDRVRDLLEAHYAELESVTSPVSLETATIVFGAFANCQAIISDIGPLNLVAREEVIRRGLYPATKDNLMGLASTDSIELDVLLQADIRLFKHALGHLDQYLTVFEGAGETHHTVENPHYFAEIVRAGSECADGEDVRRMVSLSSENCVVQSITEVPASVWPTIVSENRTCASFANVHSYIVEHPTVDDALASFLTKNTVIEWEEGAASVEDRRVVSEAVLNATELLPIEARIQLVSGLRPGELMADNIKPEAGIFVSRLIEEHLLPDDAETFGSGLMVDWITREAAIAVSEKYESFVSPQTMPVSQLPRLLQSDKIGLPVKKAVVDNLRDYLTHGTSRDAEAIASALIAHGWRIGITRIQALKASGVSEVPIVRLITREREADLSIDKLRELLRAMGEPYAMLADPGYRPWFVPDDPEHRVLIQRLTDVTVSSYKQVGSQIKVNLFRSEK